MTSTLTMPAAAAAECARTNDRQRVLVVDDNPDLADGLAMLLRIEGLNARSAYGAVQALQIAADWSPHACILDLRMPVMDGYELATRLRSTSPAQSDLRLIAQTGWDVASSSHKCASSGFQACLQKPVDLAVLLGLLSGSGPADVFTPNMSPSRHL